MLWGNKYSRKNSIRERKYLNGIDEVKVYILWGLYFFEKRYGGDEGMRYEYVKECDIF